MGNYGLTNFNGNNSLANLPTWASSMLSGFTRFVYAGEWIRAQKELERAAIQARNEERITLIEALKEIAIGTQDQQMRNFMFQQLMMFGLQG